MTDQHIYINNVGAPLLILRSDDLGNGITLDQGYIELEIPDPVAEHGVRLALDTYKLLELIDAAAPDAMRAYLRERSDYLDSPHDRTPGPVAEHFDYLDAIPEADSPEDVDERPARDDPTERAQLDRAWALERAHHLFPHAPSLQAVKVAKWIIDGEDR